MSDYARFKEINKLLASGHPELAREGLRGLQAHVIALHDEVSRLHARIGNFEELLSIPRAVTQENGLVWINTKNGRQGPFCPHCHEAEGSLIRLTHSLNCWVCPCCAAEIPLHPTPSGCGKARIIPFSPEKTN